MDFLNKKCILALNCLRDEVMALRKSIDTIRDEYKTQREYDRNQPPPPAITQSELQVPEATERDHGRRDDRSHRQQVWLTVGTWLAFGAAVGYAGIATWQTSEIRRNFRRDQRAMMKVTSEAPDMVVNPVSYPVHLSNVGKTPALNIHAEFQFQFLRRDEPPIFDYKRHPISIVEIGVLYSGDSQSFLAIRAYYLPGSMERIDIPINDEEMELFKNGGAWIVKNGIVTYDDLFGIRHKTTFCSHSEMKTLDVRQLSTFTRIHDCMIYNTVDNN
jgi:hypothetical protein